MCVMKTLISIRKSSGDCRKTFADLPITFENLRKSSGNLR